MIDVKAVKPGFFGGVRRRVGDTFVINEEKEMGRWMEKNDSSRDNGSSAMKENEPAKGDGHPNDAGPGDLNYMSGQSPKNIDKAKRNPRKSGMQGD